MPRGVRNSVKTINEQIAEVEAKIANYRQKISKLNSKKKELIASREKAEMDALYKAVRESGKTPSELISEIEREVHSINGY